MSDAAQIAESLEGRWEGRQYRCRCPVHGGRSLMVRDGDNGPIVHCFGGCEARAVLCELRTLGLTEPPSDEQKAEWAAQRRAQDVEKATRIVHIAHEAEGEITDRFGKDYRWARKVLKNAGYVVRMVPKRERQWPGQNIRIEPRHDRSTSR